jgi:hypothetical protein
VVSLLVIAMSPVVLVAGELVSRPVRRRCGPVGRAFIKNPVWIALTAPSRWVLDHLRPRVGGRNGNGGNGPPGAGVREPRRPLPDLPAGAMALPDPTDPRSHASPAS